MKKDRLFLEKVLWVLTDPVPIPFPMEMNGEKVSTVKELCMHMLMQQQLDDLLSLFTLHCEIKENVPSNLTFEEHLIRQLDLMTKCENW